MRSETREQSLCARSCPLRRIGYQKCINSLDTIVQQGYRVISVLRVRIARRPTYQAAAPLGGRA